jgi:hypothetical protein
MRKIIAGVLLTGMLTYFMPMALSASDQDDFEVIKKAVKENREAKPNKEVKWFKLQVTDHRTGKDIIRISLPIIIAETMARCSEGKHMKFEHHECDFSLKDILKQLKELGPQMFIEISAEKETLKLWIE